MKKERKIYCDDCLKEIEFRGDLVVSRILFEIIPYHASCYGKALTTKKTILLSNEPLNGPFATFISFLFCIAAIVALFFDNGWIISILCLVFPALRLYIWKRFERYLEV
ncbi:hypothetical protein HNQ94_002613 [Salirhabdus euzebyi]|uniref:Uncharacterized protein n=1 Tax=Salirhabdus euzebyi TaxID=394506 RepID=A0A841Q794_9BACI|nr:hypothetical protein [Salirhabdus euzebyi]MBB6454162.1 hypothetical protein [Salirhabdus euzebyi]